MRGKIKFKFVNRIKLFKRLSKIILRKLCTRLEIDLIFYFSLIYYISTNQDIYSFIFELWI